MKKILLTLLATSVICCASFYRTTAQNNCLQCEGGSTTGTNASIVGTNNSAIGNSSFAGGEGSIASGNRSFAFGHFTTAEGSRSIALGKFVNAIGGSSVAIGRYVKTTTTDAIVIGYGIDTGNYISNNINNSLMIGLGSNVPTFFIKGRGGINRTGKIGIGNVTDPQAKLHIKSDLYEEASLMLEPPNNITPAILYFGNETNHHKISASISSDFKFISMPGKDFTFENGNVGFGTDQPAAKIQVKDGDIFIEDIDRGIIMKSPDGNCWRGTVNNNGMMEFAQEDCQTLETDIENPKPSSAERVKIYPNPTGNTVTVEISSEYAGALLSIKSSEGKELVSSRLNNSRNTINLGSYPAGVYFFYISLDDNLLEVKKVVKE